MPTETAPTADAWETPSLLRRFAAIFYDTLLLAGVLMVAATLVVMPTELAFGHAISPHNPLYRLYLFGVGMGFFVWPWAKGGQTLGMRTWKIRLVRDDGSDPRWRDAALRAVAALLSWAVVGLGFFWPLFDAEHRTWHGRLSHTRLVLVKPGARTRLPP